MVERSNPRAAAPAWVLHEEGREEEGGELEG